MSSGIAVNGLSSVVAAEIENGKENFANISHSIWSHPELNYEEVHAHDCLTDTLDKLGFSVTRNYGLPTAFKAEYVGKGGNKPVIAVLCEYDALPEMGHACGHNLIAESGVVAGVGVKKALEIEHSISGTIVVLGCPAEEGGGGKIKLIEYGAFKEIDICMMVHPSPYNIIYTNFIGYRRFSIKFFGVSAHAAAFPWQGINALDAAVQCYNSVSMLRQQMKPSCRIHGIILNGGVLPNIIPSETEMKYYIRAPSTAQLDSLHKKLELCVKSASQATGCTYGFKVDMGYKDLITNKVIGRVFKKHGEALGVEFQDEDPNIEKFTASSDVGDVSHEIPTIQPSFYIGTDAPNHSDAFNLASDSDTAQPYTLAMGRIMALTVLEFFLNPDLVDKAQRNHKKDLIIDKQVL